MSLEQLDSHQLDTLLCASSFRHFVERFWSQVSRDKFKGGYLVDALCHHLQAVKEGRIKRIAIALPVRHGKSIITSVLFPAWLWIHDPTLRLLTVSNGERLALRDALRSRILIQCPLYRRMFGHIYTLDEEQNAKGHYKNSQLGFRLSLGTSSNTNGEDADYIICDDGLDYDKAKSDAERASVIDYYQGTLSQRLVMGNGKDRELIVGHRVHEDDLFNHVFETFGNDGTWTYLVLPAEAQPEITNSYFNAIGWKDTRAEGEILNPERYGRAELDVAKKKLRHKYHCLYQQNPTPEDGDLFKAEWFRYYTETPTHYVLENKHLKKSDAWRFATCDTAVSTATGSDFTVVQIWDCIGDNMILAEQFRKRLDGVRIVPYLAQAFKDYQPQFLAVEQQFVGKFVIDQLKNAGVVIKPFNAQRYGDKETRAIAAEIRLEAGKVWFPADKSFVADMEKEILSFPNGAHDDVVDALSCAATLADKYLGELKEELTPEQKAEEQQRKETKWFNDMLNYSPYELQFQSRRY